MKAKKQTQLERVINKLNRDGFITRNECLRVYISRLGALINKLKVAGWEFEEGEYTDNGDYIYRVKESPYHKVVYTLPNGKEIITYQP